MPLLRIDMIRGRSPEQVGAVADAVQHALVDVLRIPERDVRRRRSGRPGPLTPPRPDGYRAAALNIAAIAGPAESSPKLPPCTTQATAMSPW